MAELAAPLVASGTSPATGLTEAEARARLQQYGPNAVDAQPPESWVRVLLRQFRSVIVVVLGGAALFSFFFQDYAEGYAILAVIFINAFLGFGLEWNAQASMTALRRMGQATARVLREGQVRALPADQLTVGDVLLVEAGEVVAADAELFEMQQLQVNESALTGESMPVEKRLPAGEPNAALAEQPHRLFKGTAVVNGTGRAVVTGVGSNTQLGAIVHLVQGAERTATPLEAKLNHLARQLVFITIGLAVLFVVGGLLQGKSAYSLLKTAIVLAVAAIPEGLSIVATLALAYGMLRLARRSVLVKRLAAVETLGSTDVIFTDKTGTLTQNQMAVDTVRLSEASLRFPLDAAHPAVTSESYQLLLRVAVLCNNASYSPAEAEAALGDPLEVALLALAHQAGFDVPGALETASRLAELPFNSDTRLMATLHRHHHGQAWVAVKGAAEEVLRHCTQQHTATGAQPLAVAERAEWLLHAEHLAQTGLRTLALAYRILPAEDQPDWAHELTWLGLVAFLDPPRPEVIPALDACRRAGILVLMATGDHPATALTVARQVHLATDGDGDNVVVTGAELPDLLTQPHGAAARFWQTRVFARVSPAQKLDLIRLYQEQGHIVAMTGDGVNDAPALKKADIGVAMGQRGTQVASEAAALVLRDDSFASIVAAVEQGRIIFTNIRRFVLYLVSCNLSEILVVTASSMLLPGAGLLPLQILFLNLLTDVFPALALGVGKGSATVMNHRPHEPQAPVMRPGDWRLAVAYASLMTAALLGTNYLARYRFGLSPEAANAVLFYGLGAAQLLHVFNMAGIGTPLRANDVLRNQFVWLALGLCAGLLLLTYYQPALHELMSIVPLPPVALLLIVAPAVAVLVLGQLLGHALRRWQHRTAAAAPVVRS
ncbi:cation-transporting P-type ATPase [Hymenobacter sp. BT683]|uniref:Cation-transporting P-type ATPase n=1 Tax=Hymenobacter jeongseonensis TaxID=2791027 RepID=A0ABS0IHC3_9BACT|nr:cation-transporting P-type ATPase [Hymenobacter jeongseonensis]MBF9237757.1 cation-transporting P-type ATPase [Hymenobacter jeongseonensis]